MNPQEIEARAINVYVYALLMGLPEHRALHYKHRYIKRVGQCSFDDFMENLRDSF